MNRGGDFGSYFLYQSPCHLTWVIRIQTIFYWRGLRNARTYVIVTHRGYVSHCRTWTTFKYYVSHSQFYLIYLF